MGTFRAVGRLVWKDIKNAPMSLIRGVGSTLVDIFTGTGDVSRDAQNQAEANWENKREEYRIISEELKKGQEQEWQQAAEKQDFRVQVVQNQTGAALGALRDEVSGKREQYLREKKQAKARMREARMPTEASHKQQRQRTMLEERIRGQTAPSRTQEQEQER